jgi:hypothetical protein
MGSDAAGRWRWWALRAALAFGVVYALGVLGVPTFVPYLAVVFVVVLDAVNVARRRR